MVESRSIGALDGCWCCSTIALFMIASSLGSFVLLSIFHSNYSFSLRHKGNISIRSQKVEIYSLKANFAAATLVFGLFTPTFPLGNLVEAIRAYIHDPNSITCTLDNQNADENHGSCQQLPYIVRYRAGKVLTIKQDWGSSASTGAAVWNGANMLAWYLENKLGSSHLNNKNVLELGAGVGFGSLVASALGARNALITDGNLDVLELAKENININVSPQKGKSISTYQLRWGTDDEVPLYKQSWDYILASDVTYKRTAWPSLLSTISKLSGPTTETILAMEPRNIGEVEGVLAEAESKGLEWTEMTLPVDKAKTQCNLLCARLFVLKKNPNIISSYVVSTFLPSIEY